jgi:curli biogenesis system outer membrane secretion channel CsgG
VDVNTGAILAFATGAGQSTKSQTTAGGAGDGSGAGLSEKSSDFNNPMVAEATNKAIAAMSMQLEAEVTAMPAPPPAAR